MSQPNKRRLTLDDARMIRWLVSRNISKHQLAGQYGVGQDTIRAIVAGTFLPEPTPVAPPASDVADPIALYRQERAKRAAKRDPRLDAAREAFQREIATDRNTVHVGRPKGSKNGNWKTDDALFSEIA
jgi:hypothetical protein